MSKHDFDTICSDDVGSLKCKVCGYTTHYTDTCGSDTCADYVERLKKELEGLQKSNLNLSVTVEVLESEKSNIFRTLEEAGERIDELESQLAYEYGCNADLINLQDENEKLKKRLENAVELPCKVGDTVWCIVKEKPQDLTKTVDNQPKEYYTNNKGEVRNIIFNNIDHKIYVHFAEKYSNASYSLSSAGKYLFATREQAEQKLKEKKHNED